MAEEIKYMPDTNIEILRKETYLKTIENSIGSKLFNSVFVKFKNSGKIRDILNDGEYSCAFFVSSILCLLQAVDEPRATVKSLRNFLENNDNWKKIDTKKLEAGDVIFWEKVKFEDGSENEHVGFILNKNEAVSTDYKTKMVVKHPILKVGQSDRAIESAYRYYW